MSEALSTFFDYDVADQKAREGMGHYWLNDGASNECHWCGTRSHWPGAAEPCSAQKDAGWLEVNEVGIGRPSAKKRMQRARASQIRALHARGMSVSKIAAEVRMSRTGVGKIIAGERLANI